MSASNLLQDGCLLKIGHETMKNLLKRLVASPKVDVLNHNIDKCAIRLQERWTSSSNQVLRRWIHETRHQIMKKTCGMSSMLN
jgi:hypothetical protein